MAALFPRTANTSARVGVVALFAILGGLVSAPMIYARTPYFTEQGAPVVQPVQFDHRHHVADDGIDCRYCHQTVESSPSAGFPSTGTCMNCHAQIWNRSPMLGAVREAWFEDRPIAWNRVHRLPDFVYFNHSIHVAKGVGCVTCHGPVDRMAAISQQTPLTMGWCLGCHRDPAPNLRPREEITSTTWKPEGDPVALGHELARRYDVHTRTSCTTCHR